MSNNIQKLSKKLKEMYGCVGSNLNKKSERVDVSIVQAENILDILKKEGIIK